MMNSHTALLLVDIQNDFFPGGALDVPGAYGLFPLINHIQTCFKTVIATQDWHPADHTSFVTAHPNRKVFDVITLNGIKQTLWPPHCVQNTIGAELHPQLQRDKINIVIKKGTDKAIDSYSAFFDNAHQKKTDLEDTLKKRGIDTLYFTGLATDYCVLYSVLDALTLGFKVFVIRDACFGLATKPDDIDNTFKTMKEAGAVILQSSTLIP